MIRECTRICSSFVPTGPQETPAHDEPAPECVGSSRRRFSASVSKLRQVAGMSSRDNHNGNARGGRPNYYLWKPPPYGQNLPETQRERASGRAAVRALPSVPLLLSVLPTRIPDKVEGRRPGRIWRVPKLLLHCGAKERMRQRCARLRAAAALQHHHRGLPADLPGRRRGPRHEPAAASAASAASGSLFCVWALFPVNG